MYGLWGYLLKAKALAPINARRVLEGGWYLKQLRSVGNVNGNINENGIKAIGLDCQNNNFAHVSCFFLHIFAVTARPRCEILPRRDLMF